eukprot:gb/GEZN01013658.1/.p1 GENE.gb/GEZN01013658.1/~~gb/GEZN01013658.1/.p1  ORF type:complete len:128 (+),score=12.34 gb/GEZN01013658.1/:499-882(+)
MQENTSFNKENEEEKYNLQSRATTTVQTKRVTGDGSNYVDLQTWTFSPSSSKACHVTGCSASQVFSIGDYGTNYCNLHDLYCMDTACCPIQGDPKLVYKETVGQCTQASVSACYVQGYACTAKALKF